MRPIGIVTMSPVYCAVAACHGSGSGSGSPPEGAAGAADGAATGGRARPAAGAAGEFASADGSAPAVSIYSDGQVVCMIIAANADAIDEAQVALGATDGGASDGDGADASGRRFGSLAVGAFAAMMIGDHSMSNTVIRSFGIAPEPSSEQRALQTAAQAAMGRLLSLSGPAFDVQYMQTQVTEHVTMCDLVRDKLVPAASHPQLKAYLVSQFLPTIESHLDSATAILARLANGDGADAPADSQAALEP